MTPDSAYRARQRAAVRNNEAAIGYLTGALIVDDVGSIRRLVEAALNVLGGAPIHQAPSPESTGVARPLNQPKPKVVALVRARSATTITEPLSRAPEPEGDFGAVGEVAELPLAEMSDDSLEHPNPARSTSSSNEDLAALKSLFGDLD